VIASGTDSAIKTSMEQHEFAARNRLAWEADSYGAWVRRYGTQIDAAATIVADPAHSLRRVLQYLGDPSGLTIANPLDSHGRIATALALLGARVTVFDISDSNARYARALASAAGVENN
jgi:hypothetical protein